ncbi:MAG TPA: helix-turn-helix transcriptional regulator [Ktedonobacteraceae bacterium]|nr:helix-turn-helix transcriptional regulator [Ktedonobacteraceae bacterium]
MVREATATLSSQEAWNGLLPEEPSLEPANEVNGLYDAPPATAGGPGPFALLLGFLVKNDRNEILRIAREIGVSDNTVYRWLNGTSEPRQSHMQRLLEVLPQSRATLPSHSGLPAPGGVRGSANHPGRWDVPKELYRRVMEQAATTVDDTSRRWHIIETIFEYALLHLDPDHHGLALTYARLMPPRADGSIHSLYEAEMRGQAPWPFALDFKAYLGSTTLAGSAAMFQRVYSWSIKDPDARIPVGLDPNERSSCAAPVMRGGRLAGVLIVSSTQEDFVHNPAVPRTVGDYAHLLAASLMDSDFYPVSLIKLAPMPELEWQRERISRAYLNRVIEYARKQGVSFSEAEQQILQDLEDEFERYASSQAKAAKIQQHSVEP